MSIPPVGPRACERSSVVQNLASIPPESFRRGGRILRTGGVDIPGGTWAKASKGANRSGNDRMERTAGSAAKKGKPAAPAQRIDGSIPMRTLGSTGERVAAIGLGGVHRGEPDLPGGASGLIIRRA